MVIEKILSALPAGLTGGRPMEPLDDTNPGELGYYLGRRGRVWFCRTRCDRNRYAVHNQPEELPVKRIDVSDTNSEPDRNE